MVINLTLLHSQQTLPCQQWCFEDKSVIRIGRAPDNDVVIYSAVVSRYHLELHRISGNYWKIVNLGTNGTYVNDEGVCSAHIRPITQVPVIDGMVIRLASSGPRIKIQKCDKLSGFKNLTNPEGSEDKTEQDMPAVAC
ncbi:MAG: hypothetical protein Fur0025_39250 [Oscillatoriaceae cyanobacterium]